GKRINVTLRDPSVEVGVDVLHVFRLARVDVAREVQVEVVRCALDLRKRSEPGIALDLRSLSEDIDDLVDVPSAKPVLVAVLDVAPARVDHQDPTTRSGALLVEHDHAGRNAGAVEKVDREPDDRLDQTAFD